MTPSFSVDGVIQAVFGQAPKSQGGGRALMYIAAQRGVGVSTIVRATVRATAEATTYCVDLDMRRNALVRDFINEGPPIGPKMDGKLNGASFYALFDANNQPVREMHPAFGYHRIGRTRAYVGAFETRAVPPGGQVMISSAPDYWDAVRAGGALVVVDAPALERSHLALRVARHMDGVVLVTGPQADAAPSALAAKAELEAAGANVIGVVYNQASAPVMAMERLFS